MNRVNRAFVAGAGVCAVVWSGVVLVAGEQGSTVSVFTAEQANAGRTAYAKHCGSCHSADLSGNDAPALAGSNFMSTWATRSTKDLFDYMSAAMPPSGEALNADTYASIVAYILRINGANDGTQAFTPSSEVSEVSIGSVTRAPSK